MHYEPKINRVNNALYIMHCALLELYLHYN